MYEELEGDQKRVYRLAGELGKDSRYFEHYNNGPNFSHSDYMLTLIEFWTHLNIWSKSKDAERGSNKPELSIPNYLKKDENDFDDFTGMTEEEVYAFIYEGREENLRRE